MKFDALHQRPLVWGFGLYSFFLLAFNKGFTYLHVWIGSIPLFITEALFVVGLLFVVYNLVKDPSLKNRMTQLPWPWVGLAILGVAVVIALARLFFEMEGVNLNALKKAALGYYPFFALVGFSVFSDKKAISIFLSLSAAGAALGALLDFCFFWVSPPTWWPVSVGVAAESARAFLLFYALFSVGSKWPEAVRVSTASLALTLISFTAIRSVFVCFAFLSLPFLIFVFLLKDRILSLRIFKVVGLSVFLFLILFAFTGPPSFLARIANEWQPKGMMKAVKEGWVKSRRVSSEEAEMTQRWARLDSDIKKISDPETLEISGNPQEKMNRMKTIRKLREKSQAWQTEEELELLNQEEMSLERGEIIHKESKTSPRKTKVSPNKTKVSPNKTEVVSSGIKVVSKEPQIAIRETEGVSSQTQISSDGKIKTRQEKNFSARDMKEAENNEIESQKKEKVLSDHEFLEKHANASGFVPDRVYEILLEQDPLWNRPRPTWTEKIIESLNHPSIQASPNVWWRANVWGELLAQLASGPWLLGVGFDTPLIVPLISPYRGEREIAMATYLIHPQYELKERLKSSNPSRDVNPVWPMAPKNPPEIYTPHWYSLDPHNSHLSILYRMGFVGFMGYVIFLFSALFLLLKTAVRRNPLAMILFLTLSWYVLVACFNVVLEGPFMGAFFWLLSGVSLSALLTREEENERL